MKFTLKNILIIVVVGFLAVISVLPLFAEKKSYTDESYWINLCSGVGLKNNEEDCKGFRDYQQEKINKANQDLKDQKIVISDIKSNSQKYGEIYASLEKEVKELEAQVALIQAGIKKTQAYIVQLEADILKQEQEVEVKEQQVKDYIASSQSQTYTNTFIEFIMGAKDFSEVITRMEGMKRIKEYNDDIIDDLNAQKANIEEDKKIAVESVRVMQLDEQVIETKKAEMKVKADDAQAVYLEFERLAAAAEAESAKITKEIKYNQDQLINIEQIPSSGGWFHVLGNDKSKFTNNAWGFKYRGGSLIGRVHSGADYAPYGSARIPVYAPGNGFVVLASENGCGDGSISDSCGSYWGNWVSLIVDINGEIFGVSMAHLTAGTLSVRQGQQVSAGQKLANVGTSGMSTGVHLHIETYRLAEKDLVSAVSNFSKHGNRNFQASNRFCHLGAAAPCKVDAPLLLGDRTAGPGYYN